MDIQETLMLVKNSHWIGDSDYYQVFQAQQSNSSSLEIRLMTNRLILRRNLAESIEITEINFDDPYSPKQHNYQSCIKGKIVRQACQIFHDTQQVRRLRCLIRDPRYVIYHALAINVLSERSFEILIFDDSIPRLGPVMIVVVLELEDDNRLTMMIRRFVKGSELSKENIIFSKVNGQ